VEQELRDRWTSIAGTGRTAEQALAGLLSRNREPHRSYHGLAHLVRVLRAVDDLVPAVEVDDADALRFAAWFHDAVYDPRASTNEAASAHLAIEVLTELGQPADRATRTAALVEATAGHVPTNPDEAVLIDADLAVLGADPATYEAYARGVRKEYVHVDDEAWRVGRAAVLQGFLDRPAIFHTAPMLAFEPRARANLAAELAGLRAPGAG
jgi:predicted metal-dependent HD superfamily phosphohydrolase